VTGVGTGTRSQPRCQGAAQRHFRLQIGGRARPRMMSLAETTMTADSLQPTAYGFGRMQRRNTPERSAVSRKPMARPDALVYELYGLTQEEVSIVEGERG